MDGTKIVYDLVKEVREEQREIRNDINDIKHTLAVNTNSLQEHMRRTEVLEGLYYNHQSRISELEEPKKIREAILKRYIKVAGVITATLTVLAAWAKWKGLI